MASFGVRLKFKLRYQKQRSGPGAREGRSGRSYQSVRFSCRKVGAEVGTDPGARGHLGGETNWAPGPSTVKGRTHLRYSSV